MLSDDGLKDLSKEIKKAHKELDVVFGMIEIVMVSTQNDK